MCGLLFTSSVENVKNTWKVLPAKWRELIHQKGKQLNGEKKGRGRDCDGESGKVP